MSFPPLILSECALYRYELPLTAPLSLGEETVSHRRGLLVRLTMDDGSIGWGDAAPLVGFSREARSDVEEHARSVLRDWVGKQGVGPEVDLDGLLENLPIPSGSPASFRFALETAVLDILATVDQTSVPDLLGTPQPSLELNALVSRSAENGPKEAVRHQEAGYRAIKLKVGDRDVEDDIARVRSVRRALERSVALRIDANRAWSYEEAETFAENVADLDLAYVEEPLDDPARLTLLADRTTMPIALDETTREVEAGDLRQFSEITAVILKPTLLGGLLRSREWMHAAEETGTTPVISAAYESGVGLRMLVALAAVGPEIPVGLSTYDQFAADVYAPALPLRGPRVEVASVADPVASRIARDRLELIERFRT